MRRIKIDQLFHKTVLDFNDNLFSARSGKFKKPLPELQALLNLKGTKKKFGIENKIALEYLKKIIDNYKDILSADEEQMENWIVEFRDIIHEDKITEKFWKAIVKAMQYKALRGLEMLQFLQKSNIKPAYIVIRNLHWYLIKQKRHFKVYCSLTTNIQNQNIHSFALRFIICIRSAETAIWQKAITLPILVFIAKMTN